MQRRRKASVVADTITEVSGHYLVSGQGRKAKPRSRVVVETYDVRRHGVQLKIESNVESVYNSRENLSWIKEILIQKMLKETFFKEQQMN